MIVAREPRLAIAERPTVRDHLHGAWWPYGTVIEPELVPLIEAVGTRFRSVLGVMLDHDEWPSAPRDWQPDGVEHATLTWHTLPEPHLAILRCSGHYRLRLLVLPPDTPEDVALTATLLAVRAGNELTTSQALARASAGSVLW